MRVAGTDLPTRRLLQEEGGTGGPVAGVVAEVDSPLELAGVMLALVAGVVTTPDVAVAIGGATVGPDAGDGAVAVLRASGNSVWKALCIASSTQRWKSPIGGGA